MIGIGHSVGPGKPNSPADVRTVQHLLNRHMAKTAGFAAIAESGQFDQPTEAAILRFQTQVLGVRHADGIVDPHGRTIRALLGKVKQPWPSEHVTHFIQMALPAARAVKVRWGVPIAVTIAQSAQETGWGRTVKGNAWFGIKGKSPTGESTSFGTHEEVAGGKNVNITAKFRAYHDYADAADDYGRYLASEKRYAAAFKYKNDPIAFVEKVAKAGYATDHNYAKSLTSIIRHYHLFQYDK